MDFNDEKTTSYEKDKHATVRTVLTESVSLGFYQDPVKRPTYNNDNGPIQFLMVFVAHYVMEMGILCVDAKVMSAGSSFRTPTELFNRAKDFTTRVMETHDFPSAVRRSVILAEAMKDEFLHKLQDAFGEKFTEPKNEKNEG